MMIFVVYVPLGHGIYSSGTSSFVFLQISFWVKTCLKRPNRGVVFEKKWCTHLYRGTRLFQYSSSAWEDSPHAVHTNFHVSHTVPYMFLCVACIGGSHFLPWRSQKSSCSCMASRQTPQFFFFFFSCFAWHRVVCFCVSYDDMESSWPVFFFLHGMACHVMSWHDIASNTPVFFLFYVAWHGVASTRLFSFLHGMAWHGVKRKIVALARLCGLPPYSFC